MSIHSISHTIFRTVSTLAREPAQKACTGRDEEYAATYAATFAATVIMPFISALNSWGVQK